MTAPALVAMTPQPFAHVTRECALANIGQTIADAFCTLGAALEQAKVEPAGPPMARYSHFADGRVSVDLGFPVHESAIAGLRAAGLRTGMTAGGEAMSLLHVGPYQTLQQSYDAVLAAIAAAGRAPAEEMWERYLDGPETPAEKTRTEVSWPLQPAPGAYE